jgi:DNA-binding winged helix-turn-helix (wHTH) protein
MMLSARFPILRLSLEALGVGQMPREASYEFGAFRLDPIEGTLVTGGTIVPMDPKTCELLRVFLKNPQRTLSIDFLIQEVWDDDLDTSDHAVAFQIHQLRRKLNDDANHPQFIKTLRKRGFQFLQRVRRVGPTGEAAELYEKARYFFHKSAPPSVMRAIELFERIVSLDKEYVPDAFAGIAESLVLLGTFAHQVIPASEAMPKAREAALRAIALDADTAEAHNALASVAALYDWQWGAATKHFHEALRRITNPLAKPFVRAWYAICLGARGESKSARHEIDRAKTDFPSSFLVHALSGRIAYVARDAELAISECDEAIALEEGFYLGHLFKGHALRYLRQYGQAVEAFAKACELTGDNPVCQAELAHTYALQDREKESLAIRQHIEQIAAEQYVSPHVFAIMALGRGDHDEALTFLERTLEERGAYLIALTTDPVYDPLRANRRFAALVRKVGFVHDNAAGG